MSKLVKRLVSRDISNRLDGVSDAILVNVVGLTGNANCDLRREFRSKGISVLVVKRTMAARATEGTSLRPAFDDANGTIAIAYGCEDFVTLAKEVTAISNVGPYKLFEIKGGVMDGEALSAEKVKAISKWPSRQEQIAMLVGQILAPGASLAGQLVGGGRKLASQIKKIIEKQEE